MSTERIRASASASRTVAASVSRLHAVAVASARHRHQQCLGCPCAGRIEVEADAGGLGCARDDVLPCVHHPGGDGARRLRSRRGCGRRARSDPAGRSPGSPIHLSPGRRGSWTTCSWSAPTSRPSVSAASRTVTSLPAAGRTSPCWASQVTGARGSPLSSAVASFREAVERRGVRRTEERRRWVRLAEHGAQPGEVVLDLRGSARGSAVEAGFRGRHGSEGGRTAAADPLDLLDQRGPIVAGRDSSSHPGVGSGQQTAPQGSAAVAFAPAAGRELTARSSARTAASARRLQLDRVEAGIDRLWIAQLVCRARGRHAPAGRQLAARSSTSRARASSSARPIASAAAPAGGSTSSSRDGRPGTVTSPASASASRASSSLARSPPPGLDAGQHRAQWRQPQLGERRLHAFQLATLGVARDGRDERTAAGSPRSRATQAFRRGSATPRGSDRPAVGRCVVVERQQQPVRRRAARARGVHDPDVRDGDWRSSASSAAPARSSLPATIWCTLSASSRSETASSRSSSCSSSAWMSSRSGPVAGRPGRWKNASGSGRQRSSSAIPSTTSRAAIASSGRPSSKPSVGGGERRRLAQREHVARELDAPVAQRRARGGSRAARRSAGPGACRRAARARVRHALELRSTASAPASSPRCAEVAAAQDRGGRGVRHRRRVDVAEARRGPSRGRRSSTQPNPPT